MHKQQTQGQSIGTMSRSMLIVMVFTMVGKATGFLRDMLFASRFGAGAAKSAYATADALPCLILSIIITALSTTLIPVYSLQRKEGVEKANRFINNLFTIGIVVSVVVLLLTSAFLEPLANFIMRESDDMETRRLTLELARVMMPMGIFVFLSRISNAYLQANFNFTTPAVSQLVLNIVLVGSILLSRGVNLMYVAVGTVVGWALQFLIQAPALRKAGLSYRPTFSLREPGIREVAILSLPILLSGTFDQLYLFVDKMVAYRGDIGDPGKLDYAYNISTMVSAVLLTTIATILYPNLVRNTDNKRRFAHHFSFGINLIQMIALPAMAALILLCVPVTRIVYERGKFGSEDTLIIATLLASYAAGILGIGLREICNRCFYAFKDTITPMLIGVGVVVVNIGLDYALHPILGPAGIALANAISVTCSGLLLLFLAHRKKGVVDIRRILRCLWKTLLATGGMAAVLLGLYRVFSLGTATGMMLFAGLLISVVIALVVYVGVLLLLKTEELTQALAMAKGKLQKKA